MSKSTLDKFVEVNEVLRVNAIETYKSFDEIEKADFLKAYGYMPHHIDNIIKKIAIGEFEFVKAVEDFETINDAFKNEVNDLEVDFVMIAGYSPEEAQSAASAVLDEDERPWL